MAFNAPNTGIEIPTAPPASAEKGALQTREKLDQIQEDLDHFITGLDRLSTAEIKTAQTLFAHLAAENPTNINKYRQNILQMRVAARTQEENTKDNLKKHLYLAKNFLETEHFQDNQEAKISFKVDFKNNAMAEDNVGLGDLLPPQIESVKVIDNDGYTVTNKAIRRINKNNRIGYFDYNSGAYIPVHSGYRVIVLETKSASADTVLARRKQQEEIALYQTNQDATREEEQQDLYSPPASSASRARSTQTSAEPNPTQNPAKHATGPMSGERFPTSRQELFQMGFKHIKNLPRGETSKLVTAKAQEILKQGNPIGTTTVVVMPDGSRWAFRDEIHKHAETDNVSDNLKKPHHGVTAYQMA
jgi:hypothetical protein